MTSLMLTFEQISHIVLFRLLTLNKKMPAGKLLTCATIYTNHSFTVFVCIPIFQMILLTISVAHKRFPN